MNLFHNRCEGFFAYCNIGTILLKCFPLVLLLRIIAYFGTKLKVSISGHLNQLKVSISGHLNQLKVSVSGHLNYLAYNCWLLFWLCLCHRDNNLFLVDVYYAVFMDRPTIKVLICYYILDTFCCRSLSQWFNSLSKINL